VNDTFGREIKAGQLVAVAGASASWPFLSVGRVIGPCKEGDGVRVRVLHSNSAAFRRGLRKYRAEEMTREREQPYVATFQREDRILIIDGANVPLPPEDA